MVSINSANKRLRGRPVIDSEAVNTRLVRDLLDPLDAYRADQEGRPSRPEAIRSILKDWLSDHGYLK